MPALFNPPRREEVPEQLAAYGAYLAEKDGAPDFSRRTLARREVEMARMESAAVLYEGPFNRDLFEKQHRRYNPKVSTPPELQLLLCFLKINANEAFAVEEVMGRALAKDDVESRLLRLVLLEEGYHTRLLLSAGRLFGVSVSEPSAPVPLARFLAGAISRFPEAMSRPVTLAAEAVGIVTFLRTIGAVRRVFKGWPALRDAMEERVTEVLVDELGHLSFNRLAAHAGTFAALRAVVPAIAFGTRGAMPEGELLGILPVPVREAWCFDASTLPEEVRRRAFIA